MRKMFRCRIGILARRVPVTLWMICVLIVFLFQQNLHLLSKELKKDTLILCICENDQKTIGPGEEGHAVILDKEKLSIKDLKLYEEGYTKHGFNEYLSGIISIDRSLPPDVIPKECRDISYPTALPGVSVIIPFRNEAWSTLLRTVHSVVNRTPSRYLQEIILVDDASEADYLRNKLDMYIAHLPNVRVSRLRSQQGLSIARQLGIDSAKSDVIVVMDSHFEVADKWYQPMAKRLMEDSYLLLIPVVDTIDHLTFQYYPSKIVPESMDTASFDFYLGQTRSFMNKNYTKTLKKPVTVPIKIPAFQGGFFMANKTVFQKLGGFDKGMGVWGGEQMELSFKYWMCGGSIELIPCSRTGHVYRTRVLWHKDLVKMNVSNEYRVAEVWMDQYKHMVFEMNGNYTHKVGDISERLDVRRRNNCTSFQAYLDTISKLINIYVPNHLQASGVIVSRSNSMCLDGTTVYTRSEPLVTFACHYTGFTQYWELSSENEIRHGFVCLTSDKNGDVISTRCHEDGSLYYRWSYTKANEIKEEKTGKCLTATVPYKKVIVSDCGKMENQLWTWTRKG